MASSLYVSVGDTGITSVSVSGGGFGASVNQTAYYGSPVYVTSLDNVDVTISASVASGYTFKCFEGVVDGMTFTITDSTYTFNTGTHDISIVAYSSQSSGGGDSGGDSGDDVVPSSGAGPYVYDINQGKYVRCVAYEYVIGSGWVKHDSSIIT